MDIERAREYCLKKRGAEENFPFDNETLVFKVCNKIFAVIALEKPDRIILKCHPSLCQELLEKYDAAEPAPYFCKTSWNQMFFNRDISDEKILSLIDHAYGETLRGLSKKKQLEFFNEALGDDIVHVHKNVCKSTMGECGLAGNECPSGILLVTTDLQKCGRGQRGNHWESENGKNLLFSFSLYPSDIPANRQFLISQAVSIAVLQTLRSILPSILDISAENFSIKWPNDIYYEDKKLGGILIEHKVEGGKICRSIVGIGLNVNQEFFRSDAPNPISLRLILGFEHPRFLILEKFLSILQNILPRISKHDWVKKSYMPLLYRRSGLHPFRDGQGTFRASIADVKPDGQLVLRRADGTMSSYSFKEVSFIN